MTQVTKAITMKNVLIAQSIARGQNYAARLVRATTKENKKEIFIATTLRIREIKVYRQLIAEKAQLETLPVDCRLGYRDGRGYVAL